MGHCWYLLNKLVLMAGPKPLLAERGIHHRLESCGPFIVSEFWKWKIALVALPAALKQNVKYDSQTGKVYEELGSCNRGSGGSGASAEPSTGQGISASSPLNTGKKIITSRQCWNFAFNGFKTLGEFSGKCLRIWKCSVMKTKKNWAKVRSSLKDLVYGDR